jgi:hypothetical protein
MSMFLSCEGECAREWRGGEGCVGEGGCGEREGDNGNGVGVTWEWRE